MNGSRDLFGFCGKTIADKFRVEKVLGEGGYGVVYSGTHLLLGVPVAIKCLKPTSFSDDERQRSVEAFLSEARILFNLAHPAIVRMYDAGVHAETGVPYVVLERLSGITLADEITARAASRKPFDKDEIAAVFAPIIEGVGFAHERGIVHRDLKPSNMMLVTDGTKTVPKVLDFGTARANETARERDLATAATAHAAPASFTPLYAAPEQWDRGLGTFSARTDVYALGLSIAEACLLAYPLDVRHGLVSVVKSALDDRARPLLSEARPDLPLELERVIHKAMRVRPAERYPDAREMLASFRAALRVTTTTAPLARPVAARSSVPQPSVRPSSGGPITPVTPAMLHHATTTQPQTVPPPASAKPSSLPWIVALIALLVAGFTVVASGFVAFSLRRQDPPHAGAATTGSAEGPEEEPDPAPPPAKTRKHEDGGRRGSGPRVTLSGTLPTGSPWSAAEAISVLNAHKAELDGCAKEAEDLDEDGGDLSLILMVDPAGRVASVMCFGTHPDVCSCIQPLASRWTYPPHAGAPQTSSISYMLHVVP